MNALRSVVLAAGKGTRMKSALPKVLFPLCGRPLCAWPVDAARAAGADVVVVVGHGADQVKARLAELYPDGRVTTALQAEQKGTGHAVMQALPALAGYDGTVLLLYGDTPLVTADGLRALAEKKGAAPLALWTTRLPDPTGYGRILRDDQGRLIRIVEQKDASDVERRIDEVNPGIYAVDAAFLRRALSSLTTQNAQGEYYLTDLIEIARREGHDVVTLTVDAESTMGVNDRAQLAEAGAVLRRRVARRLMIDGVSIVDPASVYVDAGVQVDADAVLEPGVSLRGATRIGAGAIVGHGSVLVDTVVAAGARVQPYSVCEGAVVGVNAVVGPFSRLRPGADVGEEAHVGNFVEVKKTRLGKGAKANHLAYLGDSDVGAKTNIGAGTITCNYDGYGKYGTTIGEGVFVGSNSTLVAPLVLGDGAYVAAGSTVTKDVAPDALAIGRGKQENKDGYAAKLRARAKAKAGK
jgi:bifunctional UDP-N-acetylglucosamine pyrophosphorylase / glucosamine-1-phosphate N-acetyltransferase